MTWTPGYQDFMKYPVDILEEVLELLDRPNGSSLLSQRADDFRLTSLLMGGVQNADQREFKLVTFGYHARLRSMLRCWQDCQRDHLIARLTWTEDY